MKISPQLNFSWPISFSSYLRMRIPRPCSTRILLVFFSFSITFTASQHAVAQKQVTVVGEDAIQFEDKQDAILIPIRLKISKIILRSLRAGGDSTGELRLQAKWSTTGFANKFNKMSNSEKKFKTINSAKAEFFVHLPDDEGRIKTIKKNTVLVRGQVQDFIFPIPAKIVKSTLRIMLGNQSWKPTISASIEWKKNKIPLYIIYPTNGLTFIRLFNEHTRVLIRTSDGVTTLPLGTKINYKINEEARQHLISIANQSLGYIPAGKTIIYSVEQPILVPNYRNIVFGRFSTRIEQKLILNLPIDTTQNIFANRSSVLAEGNYALFLYRDRSGQIRVAYQPVVRKLDTLSNLVLHEAGVPLLDGILLRFEKSGVLNGIFLLKRNSAVAKTLFWQTTEMVDPSRQLRKLKEFFLESMSRRIRSNFKLHDNVEVSMQEMSDLIKVVSNYYIKHTFSKMDKRIRLGEVSKLIDSLNLVTDSWLEKHHPGIRLSAVLKSLTQADTIVGELVRAELIIMREDFQGSVARKSILDLFETTIDDNVAKTAHKLLLKSKKLLSATDQVRFLNRIKIGFQSFNNIVRQKSNDLVREAFRIKGIRYWSLNSSLGFADRYVLFVQALTAAGRKDISLPDVPKNDVDEVAKIAIALAEVGAFDRALKLIRSIDGVYWQRAFGLGRVGVIQLRAGRKDRGKKLIAEGENSISMVKYCGDKALVRIAWVEALIVTNMQSEVSRILDKAKEDALKCANLDVKISRLSEIAILYHRNSNKKKGEILFNKMRSMVNKPDLYKKLTLVEHPNTGVEKIVSLLFSYAKTELLYGQVEDFNSTINAIVKSVEIAYDNYFKTEVLAAAARLFETAKQFEKSKNLAKVVCESGILHEICVERSRHCKDKVNEYLVESVRQWTLNHKNLSTSSTVKAINLALDYEDVPLKNISREMMICRMESLLTVAAFLGNILIPEEVKKDAVENIQKLKALKRN